MHQLDHLSTGTAVELGVVHNRVGAPDVAKELGGPARSLQKLREAAMS